MIVEQCFAVFYETALNYTLFKLTEIRPSKVGVTERNYSVTP